MESSSLHLQQTSVTHRSPRIVKLKDLFEHVVARLFLLAPPIDIMHPNFLDSYLSPQEGLVQIKEESSEQRSSLPSTPSSSSSSSSLALPSLSPTSSRRKGSVSSLAGPPRPRPYPTPSSRVTRSQREESSTMSSSAAYGSWSHGASRSSHRTHPSVERRTSDSDNQAAFSHESQFMHV